MESRRRRGIPRVGGAMEAGHARPQRHHAMSAAQRPGATWTRQGGRGHARAGVSEHSPTLASRIFRVMAAPVPSFLCIVY